jgi:C1A family cysteine protease
LPSKVSLRADARMPPVFDQGELGSCTANSSGAAFAFEHGGGPYSRLQIYYNERKLEGTIEQDSGAEIRDAVKVLNKYGVALESEWPYDISKFTQAPSANVVKDAAKCKLVQYSRLMTHNDRLQCLAQGFPFIFGFTVYSSFESGQTATTGLVTIPDASEQVMGGHAVMCIGYDVERKLFEVRNSWGDDWGDKGNFWLPFDYLENPNLADDFWTLRK